MNKLSGKSSKQGKLVTQKQSQKKPLKGVWILYRKLGKEKARGQYIPELNLIEIDERLVAKEHLEVLIHESLHALQPHHEEDTICKDALNLSLILWADGYRKNE